MSFCANVNGELGRHPLNKRCCAMAEAYGVLLFCNTFSPAGVKIVTESRDLTQRLPKLFRKAFDVDFDQLPESEQGKQLFLIEDPDKIQKIYQAFGLEKNTTVSFP